MRRSRASRQPIATSGSRPGAISSNGKKLALAVGVRCDEKAVGVTFDDGRKIKAPLLPFLRSASAVARSKCRIRGFGTEIYWPALDEAVGVNYVLGVPEDDLLQFAGFKEYAN